MLMCLF